MNRVPDMISTKDLAYFTDMINWNVIASKTAYHFSNEVEDEDLKTLLQNVSTMHADHVRSLVQILSEGGSNE